MKLRMGWPGLTVLVPLLVYAETGFKVTAVAYLRYPADAACLASIGLLIAGTIDMMRRVEAQRQYRQGVRYEYDYD